MRSVNFRIMHNIARGFGLIELLVGMAIGLLTVVVIMQVLGVAEGFKRTTTSGADAQTNGILALRLVEADVRMAGYGFTNSGVNLCSNGIRTWFSGTVTNGGPGTDPTASGAVSPRPVTIRNGAGPFSSDWIDVLSSSADAGAAPISITVDMPTPSNKTVVSTVAGLNACDLVVYAAKDGSKACSVAQVTNTQVGGSTTSIFFGTSSGQSNYNPSGGANANFFPTGGYTAGDVILNIGRFTNVRFEVVRTGTTQEFFLRRRNLSSEADGCGTPADPAPNVDLIGNVVNIQAQYGVAPAKPDPDSQQVKCWTDAVLSTSGACAGDWTYNNLSAANANRIKAIRVAIVVRSALRERPPTAGGTCDTTTTAPVTWEGGPTIDLSSDPDWQCYRYRVYQSVIPMINVIWASV